MSHNGIILPNNKHGVTLSNRPGIILHCQPGIILRNNLGTIPKSNMFVPNCSNGMFLGNNGIGAVRATIAAIPTTTTGTGAITTMFPLRSYYSP